MGKLLKVWESLTTPAEESSKLRVDMEDPLALLQMTDHLSSFLRQCPKKNKPIILCIGTDRSTGDSLGPLTGWRLASLLSHGAADVYGTVDNPVHATNLGEYLSLLKKHSQNRPVIAVDACLGKPANVGSILIEGEPLRPGSGLNKDLPSVGDISISGVVNVGGFMEFQVLQNTRLSLVLKMSRLIANSIFFSVKRLHSSGFISECPRNSAEGEHSEPPPLKHGLPAKE